MAGFLTGLAVAGAFFAATWVVLQSTTITTIERNSSASVIIHDEDNSSMWPWQ